MCSVFYRQLTKIIRYTGATYAVNGHGCRGNPSHCVRSALEWRNPVTAAETAVILYVLLPGKG